jgi:hypothetical protein
MVELKLTEAVVGDPEPREDATTVTRPDPRPDTGWDRISRARITAPVAGRVAAQHRP